MINFAYSGHLGDLYIVLCKLKAYQLENNLDKVNLTRISFKSSSPFDVSIRQLVSQCKWCKFSEFKDQVSSEKELYDLVKENNFTYVSTEMYGHNYDNVELSDDIKLPEGKFPLTVKPSSEKHIQINKVHILIHIQTGKWGGNYKEIDVNCLIRLLYMINKDFIVILTGFSKYLSKDVDNLSKKFKVINYLDQFKDINSLMGLLSSVDLVISPEGFTSFYTMSLNKPLIFFYTYPYIMRRASFSWLAKSYSVNCSTTTFFEKVDYHLRKIIGIKQKRLTFNVSESLKKYLLANS